jgi:cytochrome c oxidase subunit 1
MTAAVTPVGAAAARRAGLGQLVAGFLVFLLMGLLGLVMRLGHSGWVGVSPDWFYRIMTLHGSGMITGTMLAAMGGYVVATSDHLPLRSGWLWGATGAFVAGAGLVIVATVGAKLATGWTVLYPLAFEGKTWGMTAAIVMYAGYALVGVGFLLYCVTVLAATVRASGGLGRALGWKFLFSGGRDTSDPLPTPAALAGTVVALDGILAVGFGVVYLVSPFLGSSPPARQVDPLFAKNVLMVFGHTFANLTIYLAAAMVYVTLPRYTGREWKTTWPVVLALNLVIVLVLSPVFHHLYQDFAQPMALHLIGQIGSYVTGVPAVLVTVIGALALIYRSEFRWSVPSILIVLGLWGWVFGGMAAVLDGTIAVNQVMHNTLWVPAHFHTYYLLGAASFTLAFFYDVTGRLSGRDGGAASRRMAWLFGLGAAGFVLALFVAGASSVPRRFAVHLPEWQIWAKLAVPFVVVEAVGLGWIVIEIAGRLRAAWAAGAEA